MSIPHALKPVRNAAHEVEFWPARIEHRTADTGMAQLGTYVMSYDRDGHSDPWTVLYDETVYVMEGRARFLLVTDEGEEPLDGELGELIALPKGTTVRYGAEPGTRLLLSIAPVNWRAEA